MKTISGWNCKKLNNIAEVVMGQSPDSKYYSDEEIGLPFLQGCGDFGNRFPIPNQYCSQVKKIAEENSILFSVRAPVGRTNIADKKYIIGRGLASIVVKSIELPYLINYFKFIEDDFSNASQGSTFQAINSAELKNWPIIFPKSVMEQQVIGNILETVDSAIEKTEELIAKHNRIKIGLMQDLLTKGIDENGNIRSEETHEFKDSPVGRIPKEWDVKSINDVSVHVGSGVTPRGGESVYKKEGVLFIRSQNVHYGSLNLSDIAYISEDTHNSMKRSEVFEDDVLLNITGASIGRCCVIPPMKNKMNVNQHVCAIRIIDSNKYDSHFISLVLESEIGKNQILQFNSGGNREGLKYENIRSFIIPWPNENERRKVFDVMNAFNLNTGKERNVLSKLGRIKTALMQDLLSGKKRVTTLLNDLEGVS